MDQVSADQRAHGELHGVLRTAAPVLPRSDGTARLTRLGGNIADDWSARFVIDTALDGVTLPAGTSLNGESPSDQ